MVKLFNPIRSLGLLGFCFLEEQMLLVVFVSNSGLFRAKNKLQMPYKK